MDVNVGLEVAGRRCRRWLTMIFAVAFAALVSERLGYAGLWGGRGIVSGRIAEQLFLGAPSFAYLAAVWRLRTAAAHVERGNAFGPQAVAALRTVGVLLLTGAVLSLVIPMLAARLAEAPSERLIEADIATLAIAAVGIGQYLLGSLLQRAGLAERELAEFF